MVPQTRQTYFHSFLRKKNETKSMLNLESRISYSKHLFGFSYFLLFSKTSRLLNQSLY